MLHIALNMTTKVLNIWDCETLELTFSATLSQISRDGWHLLNETCSVVKFSKIYDNSLLQSLDNDQLDAHLLYFTIRPLQYSVCFKHYMLIIRRFILY